MTAWLDPVRQSLNNISVPATCFFRNDDAGWQDDRLFTLLDLFATYSVPIDLAVISAELTPQLATELRRRMEAAPNLLDCHQHGWSHVNHETSGRKCEFGPSRSLSQQCADLASGRQRMKDLLDSTGEIFTPPWNRCTQTTVACLVRLGFRVLSRDVTATPLVLRRLTEVPVNIDWFAKFRGQRISFSVLGKRIADAIVGDTPVGIMLHHGGMDHDEMVRVSELLEVLSANANANCLQMKTIVRGTMSDATRFSAAQP